jgi:signal transduction histidine kinase
MRKLEERANRCDRLAAMGEMAAKIAHEIRNPLGSIELFVSTLKKELEGSDELRNLSDHILSGSKSINNIISNLLLFIRPQQKPKFQAIDIYNPLNDSLFFSSHLLKSTDSIEVISHYEDTPLKVKGDVELLKQAFLNLILNSIQAMPKGGTLTISTKKIKGPNTQGNNVEIKISDTGVGIPTVHLSRIFDPFFTSKERGTGLGLSIVNNIIVLHGGTIDVRSMDGEGTACIISLPLWEEKKRRRERKKEIRFFNEVENDDTTYTCC